MKNVLILFCLLLSMHRNHAQSADQIIEKHIEAAGGRGVWSKVSSLKYTGNYVMGPGMLAPVTECIWSVPVNILYSEFNWQGMSSKSCMAADSGWSYNPFGGKREADPMSASEIRMAKLNSDPQGLLFNFKEKGYSADYLGTDDMDGSEVFKIRLTTKRGDLVYFYIDTDSYLMLKLSRRVKLKDKEEKSTTIFADYRKTDFGIVVPFMQSWVNDDGTEGGVTQFVKVEVNVPLDQTLLAKPAVK